MDGISMLEPILPGDPSYLPVLANYNQFKKFQIGRNQFNVGDYALIKKGKCPESKSILKKNPDIVQILRIVTNENERKAMVMWFLDAKHCQHLKVPDKAMPLWPDGELLLDRRERSGWISLSAIKGTTSVQTISGNESPEKVLEKHTSFYVTRFSLYECNEQLKLKHTKLPYTVPSPKLKRSNPNALQAHSISASESIQVPPNTRLTGDSPQSPTLTRQIKHLSQSPAAVGTRHAESPPNPPITKNRKFELSKEADHLYEKCVVPESQDDSLIINSAAELSPELTRNKVLGSRKAKKKKLYTQSQNITQPKTPKKPQFCSKLSHPALDMAGPSESVKVSPRRRINVHKLSYRQNMSSVVVLSGVESRRNDKKQLLENSDIKFCNPLTTEDHANSPEKSPVIGPFTRQVAQKNVVKGAQSFKSHVVGKERPNKVLTFFESTQKSSMNTPIDVPFPKQAPKVSVLSNAQVVNNDDSSLFMDEVLTGTKKQKLKNKKITDFVKHTEMQQTRETSKTTATDEIGEASAESSDNSTDQLTSQVKQQTRTSIRMPHFIDDNLRKDTALRSTRSSNINVIQSKCVDEQSSQTANNVVCRSRSITPNLNTSANVTNSSPNEENVLPKELKKSIDFRQSSDSDSEDSKFIGEEEEKKIETKKSMFLEVNRAMPKPCIVTKSTLFVDSSDDETLIIDDTPRTIIHPARKSAQVTYSPTRISALQLNPNLASPTRMSAKPSHMSPPQPMPSVRRQDETTKQLNTATSFNPVVRLTPLSTLEIRKLTGISEQQSLVVNSNDTASAKKKSPVKSAISATRKLFTNESSMENNTSNCDPSLVLKKTFRSYISPNTYPNDIVPSTVKAKDDYTVTCSSNQPNAGTYAYDSQDILDHLGLEDNARPIYDTAIPGSSGLGHASKENSIKDSDDSDTENPLPKYLRRVMRSSPKKASKLSPTPDETPEELINYLMEPEISPNKVPVASKLTLLKQLNKEPHPVMKLFEKNLTKRKSIERDDSPSNKQPANKTDTKILPLNLPNANTTSCRSTRKSTIRGQSNINSGSFYSTNSQFLEDSADDEVLAFNEGSQTAYSYQVEPQIKQDLHKKQGSSNSGTPAYVNTQQKQIKSPLKQKLPVLDSEILADTDTQNFDGVGASQADDEDYAIFVFGNGISDMPKKSPQKIVKEQKESSKERSNLSKENKTLKNVTRSKHSFNTKVSPVQVVEMLMDKSHETVETPRKASAKRLKLENTHPDDQNPSLQNKKMSSEPSKEHPSPKKKMKRNEGEKSFTGDKTKTLYEKFSDPEVTEDSQDNIFDPRIFENIKKKIDNKNQTVGNVLSKISIQPEKRKTFDPVISHLPRSDESQNTKPQAKIDIINTNDTNVSVSKRTASSSFVPGFDLSESDNDMETSFSLKIKKVEDAKRKKLNKTDEKFISGQFISGVPIFRNYDKDQSDLANTTSDETDNEASCTMKPELYSGTRSKKQFPGNKSVKPKTTNQNSDKSNALSDEDTSADSDDKTNYSVNVISNNPECHKKKMMTNATPRKSFQRQSRQENIENLSVSPRMKKTAASPMLPSRSHENQVVSSHKTKSSKMSTSYNAPSYRNEEAIEKTGRGYTKKDKKKSSDAMLLSPTKREIAEEQEMPGRETEIAIIKSFLQRKIEEGSGGCMYISGVPGTGKTASVTQVLLQLQKSIAAGDIPGFKLVKASGMELTQPKQIFSLMAQELLGLKTSPSVAQAKLTSYFTNKNKNRLPTVLIIDELDMLCTRRQDVVYNMFDWPSQSRARLTVLAIANTMDLPERLLKGRVTSRLGLTRLVFRPYTHEQLQRIVAVKLSEAKKIYCDALQLVARKVASVSGDARRALDICRRAAEVAGYGKMVEMPHVMSALNEMLSSPVAEAVRSFSDLGKHLLRCLLCEMKRTGIEESTLQNVYLRMNESATFHDVPKCSFSQASDIVAMLSTSRILRAMDAESGALGQQLAINVNADELHYALNSENM